MYEHVLQPIQIGPMKLKNRVSFTPVWPSFATGDGHVNRELMEWVRDIVKGGAACINIGCGCVNRNIPPAYFILYYCKYILSQNFGFVKRFLKKIYIQR